MENAALLAHLRALIERQPDWSTYSEHSSPHQQWLAQARSLVNRWSPVEAAAITVAVPNLGRDIIHNDAVGRILQSVQNAIADLEFDVPTEDRLAFGAGDVYDIFRELKKVIESAEKSVFIIDPYLDATVFDLYLDGVSAGIDVKLLCNRFAGPVSQAAQRYSQQHASSVEVRQTSDAHDRVIFLDDSACFVLGQSIKDAANAKPTYLAPLPPDVSIEKLRIYNDVWNTATVV